MPKRSSKPQKDTQQLARSILDAVAPDAEPNRRTKKIRQSYRIAASTVGDSDTAQKAEAAPADGKNPAAVALGRLGGKKGGPARARKLSAAAKKRIAQKAAAARWSKRPKKK